MNGSCLCGEIRFEVVDELGSIGHCHCRMCQKVHGAAYGTYVHIPGDGFRLLAGEEHLKAYQSSNGITRTFCGNCGSALQFLVAGRDHISVTAGSLDGEVRSPVDYEIWTSSAPPWGSREGVESSHETEPGDSGGN